MNLRHLLPPLLAAWLLACSKRAGDTCKLQEGERACGKALYCQASSDGLIGSFDERGVCRAYVADGQPARPRDRCSPGLELQRDATCRARRVAPTVLVPLAFEAAGWKTGDPAKRIGMAREIVASSNVWCAGKTASDLEAILGHADARAAADDGGARSGSLSWHLGLRESGGSMMFPYDESLDADLDDQSLCKRLHITNHD